MKDKGKLPRPLVALIPLLTLIGMLALVLTLFGDDTLSGGSQIALITAAAVCVTISSMGYHVPWKEFEHEIEKTIGGIGIMIGILLMIGMLSGSWMISGAVPTFIYYGVKILSPKFFLFCACLICAVISLISGSSWTTIATLGVALIGIGKALGIPAPWCAGAIISGAYFGDKLSPLSDTTVLASSTARVDIFQHIRYMMVTTIPSIVITLIIFLIAGFYLSNDATIDVSYLENALSNTFNISGWTLVVPVLTIVMILRRTPALIAMFLSSFLAGISALILQPDLLSGIGADSSLSPEMQQIKGLFITFFGETAVQTGNETVNELVSTSGMLGMLNTLWLIMCSMAFAGAMTAGGMIESLTLAIAKIIKGRAGLSAGTVLTGIFLNLTTGDQSMSIILTEELFSGVYDKMGYERRLLSRTTEDGTTVTSVLVPWNSCGMVQSTVLGVATLAYLPFCFFNLINPIISVIMTACGFRVRKAS